MQNPLNSSVKKQEVNDRRGRERAGHPVVAGAERGSVPGLSRKAKASGELCKSILIVEDNMDVRDALAEVLEIEGYHVHKSKNGKDALEQLASMPAPVLIFLDLMMPVMNGWEFLDAKNSDVREKGHRIVTISAVSATQSLQDPEPLETAGTLSKPINLNALLATVRRFCGTPAEAEARSAEPGSELF
jgi:two-component system chemotaxis response regulator CheY